MSQIRLDKWLADAGVGTRSQVKEYLKKGRVRVNGEPVKKPETRISEETDEVSFDGEILSRPALPGICSTSRRAASRQRETAGPRPSWIISRRLRRRSWLPWDGWTRIRKAFFSSPTTAR